MSDVDALTGRSFNPVQTIQAEPNPQVSFEDPSSKNVVNPQSLEEEYEYERLAFAASRTKFATGNPDADIRNFLKIRNIAKQLTGMLDG